MMSHLNSLNYFFLGIECLWTQPIHVWLGLIDSGNFEGQRSNVLKYPPDYLIQPPGKPIHYEQYAFFAP